MADIDLVPSHIKAVVPQVAVVQAAVVAVLPTTTPQGLVRTVPVGTTGWENEPDGTLWVEYTP